MSAPLSISNVPPPRKRSEVGHRAVFDLISHCSGYESRGNLALLARRTRNPAFVRAKINLFMSIADTRAPFGTKMLSKIISGGQTGADRAGLDFAIESDLEHGGYVPRGRKAEDGRIDDRYNLIELRTSSYPARTRTFQQAWETGAAHL
jgi:Circularly permutated YpsA SLOG family